MASLTLDELRQIRGGGVRGDSRAQPKRTHPESIQKAAEDSSKAVPDEKQEKARKTQEIERKKVGHVQEQRKIPEPKAEEGATLAVKIATDEKREKVRKLREQQEQERIRKLEAQKLKEEERTQAALDKKREVLLAAQKKQEERKMKSAEPTSTKGSDEHMEKVKKAREQLEIEKKRRLEAQQVKEQQKMLAASDKKKQVHSAAQTKLDDRTKTSAGATSAPIKKVTQISAPKKAAGSQHQPSKKTQPHSAAAVHPAGLPEPSAAGSKEQNLAIAAFHASAALSAGTDHIPTGADDTSMEPGPAATHSNTMTTEASSVPQTGEGSKPSGSSADSELVGSNEEGGGGGDGQSDVLGEERESLGTGDEGSRSSLDTEPPGAPSNEREEGEREKEEEKEMVRARIEQKAAERRKRVDEIMKKAREKDKKQCVQDVSSSQEVSLIQQKSFSHNEDSKDPPEQGEGSSDSILNPLEGVSQRFGGGDARGHGFLEGSLPSSSNIPPPSLSDSEPHSGDQVIQSGGDQMTQSSDQVTQSGDQVTQSGDQVTQSGDQVTQSGDQVTQSGDQVTQSVGQVTQNGDQMIQSGDQVTHTGDQMTQNGEQMTQSSDQIQTHVRGELSDETQCASNETLGIAPTALPHAGLALNTVEPAADAVCVSNLAGSDLNNGALCKDDLIQESPSQKEPSGDAQLCRESEPGDRPHPLQHDPSNELLPHPIQDQLTEGLPPHQDLLTNVHQDVPQNEGQNAHSGDRGGELGEGGGEGNPPDLPISDPPPTEAPFGEDRLDHHDGVPAVDPNGSLSGHPDNGLRQHSSFGGDHLTVNGSTSEVHENEADQSSSSSVNFEEGEGSSDVLKLLEDD